jgi:TctA family transporter
MVHCFPFTDRAPLHPEDNAFLVFLEQGFLGISYYNFTLSSFLTTELAALFQSPQLVSERRGYIETVLEQMFQCK